MAFRNIVMNGAMQVDQRNIGNPVAATNGTFILDRWLFSGIDPDTFAAQQNLDQIEPPSGFRNFLGLRVKQPRVLSFGDWFSVVQNIEAERGASTGFGTSDTKSLTLSFWARSSLPGIHSGCLTNSTSTRSFPFAYTLTVANTWEHQMIVIPGDSTGIWNARGNGKGMAIVFNLAAMPPNTGPAGQWFDGNRICAENAVSVAENPGATFFLTGVQLEVGVSATPFESLAHDEELALCQRYFEALGGNAEPTSLGEGFSAGNSTILAHLPFQGRKRCAPTIGFDGSDFSFASDDEQRPVSDLTVIGTGTSALFISGKSTGIEAGRDGTLKACGVSRITLSSEL